MKKQMLWQITLPCLIAVLMLVLMLPVYFLSYQNARQMAVEHVSNRINTGMSNLYTQVKMHNANLYELASTKEVRNFLSRSTTWRQQSVNAYYYVNEVKSTHIVNDLIKDVLVTASSSDAVVGMGMVSFTPRRDYGPIFCVEGLDYDGFRELLLTAETYLPAQQYFSVYLCDEPCIVYQWRDYGTSPKIRISSFLSVEKMKKELGFYDVENAFLHLSATAGDTTLYKSGLPQEEPINNRSSYTLVTLEDKRLGLKAEFGIPAAYINHQVQPILYTMFIYAGLAFGVAMTISVTHIVRSFHQASPLLAYLTQSSMDAGEGNIYKRLYQALQTSDQRSEAIRVQYAELVQERKALAMDKVAHRLPLETDGWQALKEIDVLKQSWSAAQFELKQPQEADRHTMALNVIVRTLLQGIWPEGYIHVSDSNRFLCLIPEAQAGLQHMKKAIREIEQKTGAVVYVGVSLPRTEADGLPDACDEAQRAVFGAHRGQALYYSQDMRRQSEPSLFGLCRELSERMSAGNEERVSELFAQLREQLGKEHGWQPSQVLHTVASTVEYTLANTAGDENTQKIQITNRPWRDAFEDLQRAAVQHCWRIQKRKNQQKSEKADEIVGYINEHYAEPDICLTQIAEQFQVTESYISWYIKTNTGRNYTAHIEELRMREAMRLLREETIPISEIAQRVGYERINTFYKSFRRYWGNAPGSFRKEE